MLCGCGLGEVDFWIFAIDWKNISKTKVLYGNLFLKIKNHKIW
jgi:hypothetical protein